jgi:GNAT superfamily N-acetyltransferase
MSSASDLDLNVREALPSDATRIAALALQLGYEVPLAHVERMLRKRSTDYEVFVAVVPRVGVVGFLEAIVEAHLMSSRCMVIGGLIVEDEYRTVGIGKSLLARAEQWAREQRCKNARVRSNVVRERARGFYEREGFVVQKTQNIFEKQL